MYISFTGHRDKYAKESDLESIHNEFYGSIWVHGGAIGFDSQVERYAKNHGIQTWVIKPDYAKYGKNAPLIRNMEILKLGDLVVALYDGRKFGGTYFCIKKAKKMGKEVRLLEPN